MSESVGAAPSGLRRRRKLCKKSEAFLPDDVVMNILSWLPAKDVLRYQCVCKEWKDLTSTRDFTDLHFRHSFPMILKEDYDGPTFLDRCWEPAQTRSKIHKVHKLDYGSIFLSHNGLVVCSSRSAFIIYNPIYSDVVNIKVHIAPNNYEGKVCGVFFHPVQKEHCILWRKVVSYNPYKVQYKILNLESSPKWREICTQNIRIRNIEPVLIDKYFYWIVEPYRTIDGPKSSFAIMEYGIIKEECRMIPCPVYVNDDDRDFNLVDIDGVVSVVQVIHGKESVEINIWTLNDDGEQLWMGSNYTASSDVYSTYKLSKAIAFRNGELLLQAKRRFEKRLYVFNLKLRTFRKFGKTYRGRAKFLAHVTSLVSLKNLKSNICIDEDVNDQP